MTLFSFIRLLFILFIYSCIDDDGPMVRCGNTECYQLTCVNCKDTDAEDCKTIAGDELKGLNNTFMEASYIRLKSNAENHPDGRDCQRDYATSMVWGGLMDLCHRDAEREGDGLGLLSICKANMLQFWNHNNYKYLFAGHRFIAVECLCMFIK